MNNEPNEYAKLIAAFNASQAQLAQVTAERDALRELVLNAEQMLSANYASPVTVQGQRALAMVNEMRSALAGGGSK